MPNASENCITIVTSKNNGTRFERWARRPHPYDLSFVQGNCLLNCRFYYNKEIAESEAKDENQDANIGVKIIEGIVERMGYPPDSDPGTIEELHESMRQCGIRAEDNEFSRAIIEERNRGGN